MSTFTGLIKNNCLNKSKYSLGFFAFQTCYKKQTFWVFHAPFWDSHFLMKRVVLCDFSKKCFKITEKYSLALCSSFWGEKQFLLIFVPFYWFGQKKLFKQIYIFLQILLFSNMFRKTNFLSISVLVWDIVIFWLKSEVLFYFPKNVSK